MEGYAQKIETRDFDFPTVLNAETQTSFSNRELENAPHFTPKAPGTKVPGNKKNIPAFREGKMLDLRVNRSKADAMRHFAGNICPCKRDLMVI
ncbi:hypothetical protein TNCV_1682631 [Trichonephila clavipes]|nr:hypothetical protein TNCV_1682631 [Trichonephila clavipes]